MKIPEGHVLVKISELPGLVRESLRAVMKQKPIVFARTRTNYSTGGNYWDPLYNGQEESERVLREMGNNAAQAIALHGVGADAPEPEHTRGLSPMGMLLAEAASERDEARRIARYLGEHAFDSQLSTEHVELIQKACAYPDPNDPKPTEH